MRRLFLLSLMLLVLGVMYGGGGMCWIGAAIGAGLGVLSSLYGGHKAGKAAREGRRILERQGREDDAWFNRRWNQGYLDTAAGQSLATHMRDFYRNSINRADATARVAGASASSAARAKEQANKSVGAFYDKAAASDTARRDAADMAHRRSRKELASQMAGIESTRAGQISAAAGAASNALISAGAYLDSDFKGKSSKAKSSLPSVDSVPTTNAGYEPDVYDYEETPNKWMFGDLA